MHSWCLHTFLIKGYVTPARNQGDCNTCVAFAFTALLESCLLKAGAKKKDMDLSEQALIDCDNTNACNDSASIETYQSLLRDKLKWQFLLEKDYPYEGNKTNNCPKNVNWYNPGAKVETIYTHNNCSEDKLEKMVILWVDFKLLVMVIFIWSTIPFYHIK